MKLNDHTLIKMSGLSSLFERLPVINTNHRTPRVINMMETPIYRGKPPTVYNIDDYRRGLRNRPNESTIDTTDQHKVDLWTVLPAQSMPKHLHPGSECVLLVIDGRGDLTIGGKTFDLDKGSLTIIPPSADHSVRNTGADPLVVLTIQGPGPFDTKVAESKGQESPY